MLGSLGPAQQDQVIKSLPSLSSGEKRLCAGSRFRWAQTIPQYKRSCQFPYSAPEIELFSAGWRASSWLEDVCILIVL